MPFLKKYIISIRTRLYGLLLFLSVLQFIIYTCDILYKITFILLYLKNVYIPQSFRLYSHLMYFLLGVCLRLYLTDNNMLKKCNRGGKAGLVLYNLYFMCCVNLLFIISQCWCDRIFSKFNYLCIGFFVFFLELKVDSF